MTAPVRTCPACHTPLPEEAQFCLSCGAATPTEPAVPARTVVTAASNVGRVRAALADRYRVERVLGEGGMATVYLAEDLKHRRKVAVKVMHPELAATLGADRFLQEVHPKLRPVEMAVNGILLAGTCQAPMNIEETLSAAAAAASKAAILLSREAVELDPFVAQVDAEQCMGCDRCLPECAYTGALVKEAGNGKPVRRVQVNPGLCVGCGACVAVCPTRAIDLKGWTLDQSDAMVDVLVAAVPVAG